MAQYAQSPSFILHQVTCQFATGVTLFGPISLSLEPALCGLVGRNGCGLRCSTAHRIPVDNAG